MRNEKILKKLEESGVVKGVPIIYKKYQGGYREGWRGAVSKVDQHTYRVTVQFENGVEQEYAPSAFVNMVSEGYSSPYIFARSVDESTEESIYDADSGKLTTENVRNKIDFHSKYVVINLTSGEVVSGEPTKECAHICAQELTTDHRNKVYGVFKLESRFRQKRPEILSETVED